jgi:hypothetical protein
MGGNHHHHHHHSKKRRKAGRDGNSSSSDEDVRRRSHKSSSTRRRRRPLQSNAADCETPTPRDIKRIVKRALKDAIERNGLTVKTGVVPQKQPPPQQQQQKAQTDELRQLVLKAALVVRTWYYYITRSPIDALAEEKERERANFLSNILHVSFDESVKATVTNWALYGNTDAKPILINTKD